MQLLGGLSARQGEWRLTHFGNRNAAVLLARLALYPHRSHAREELIELMWPGVALEAGRNRLRQALFTLRQLLEPAGSVAAPVLVADRTSVRVVPGTLGCDALEFEQALREGRLVEARDLYQGELLPGFYDDWIADERLRLTALADRLGQAPIGALAATSFERGESPTNRVAPQVYETPMLPLYLTRFFGRETEGARLRAEVLCHRLVTLLGPGGSGKTRLAVELATALHANVGLHAGDAGLQTPFSLVAFVPLVSCTTRTQMLDALLASLPVLNRAGDPLAQASAALAGRRCLLVLDNFEQLIGSGEEALGWLTATLPGLHLLVTSRHLLGLDGEREIALAPLALPGAGMALHEAAINPAVALFVDRARAARADFHVGPRNQAALVGLVRLLEGMPLALELAASRVRSLAPAEMLALLRRDPATAADASANPQLALLARGGPRAGLDPRHASMQRTIEWSWNLLDAEPARLLAMLTVFHGGCHAAAAAAVAGRPLLDTHLLLDALVSHSLLHSPNLADPDDPDDDASAQRVRFSIYEPIREFAALRLGARDARQARANHRAWLIEWGRSFSATPPLHALRVEMPNVVAALTSALADNAPNEAVTLALALRRALQDMELPADGLTQLALAIESCTDPALQSRGHTLIGPLLFVSGRGAQALGHAERGLAHEHGDPGQRARALVALAQVRWRATHGVDGVTHLLDEALPLSERAGDIETQASVHSLRGFIAYEHDHEAQASEIEHSRALRLWEQLGNQHAVNHGRYFLAACAQRAGRKIEALEQVQQVIEQARAMHDWRRLSQALNLRASILSDLRRWTEAVTYYRECIRVAWDCMAQYDLSIVLWNLPRSLAHAHYPADALRLAAFAADFWQTRFGPLGAEDQRFLVGVRRLCARQADAATCRRWWAEGTRLSLPEAVRMALNAGPG